MEPVRNDCRWWRICTAKSCALLPVRRDTAAVTSARRCGGEAARRTVETRAALAGTAALEKQPTTYKSDTKSVTLTRRASADCPLPGQDGASSNVAQQLCR